MRAIGVVLLLALGTSAPPVLDDAALLAWAKNRANDGERVTNEAHRGSAAVLLLCREPTPAEGQRLAPPHGDKFIHVYGNELAIAPLWDRLATFPVGSLILKEKLPALPVDASTSGEVTAGATPELFTGMLKREKGYWPEHGDWEYFTLDGALSRVTSRGKLASCAKCHNDVPEQDFVFRDYTLGWGALGPSGPIGPTSRGLYFLSAQRAHVHGERLCYEPQPNKHTLGCWTNLADWASWDLSVPHAGTFRVHVQQGCGKGSGGAEVDLVLVTEPTAPQPSAEASPTRGPTKVTFSVQDTGHFQNFVWREVGTLAIGQPGRARLEVRARTRPGVAVMDLRQVRLEPVR
jgi:hypothetical protein